VPDSRAQNAPEPPALLVAVGPVDPSFLEYLALVLPETLPLRFRVHDRALPADAAFDPLRGQWNAARLLAELGSLEDAAGVWRVLGVADVDLYIPILTFVFGLAHLGAKCAVISLHRLYAQFYGLPPDPELLLRRVEKEALHEIGHTLSLRHCPNYACVMHYSNTVEEVDLKTARFCEPCRRAISVRLRAGG
jgi:archaemetzincin